MKKIMAGCLAFLALLFSPGISFGAVAWDFPLKKGDTGLSVVMAQQRLAQLGYVNFRATGRYGAMTESGIQALQKKAGLRQTGKINEETYQALFSFSAERVSGNADIPRTIGPRDLVLQTKFGEAADWASIAEIFPVGKQVTIIDYHTNESFTVERTGGEHHADVQTVDQKSKKTFLKCFGGEYTWEKRPVFVEIDGKRYAASLFGMPNASDVLQNGWMKGSVCLYFSGSTSDIGGLLDAEHVANVLIAAGQS